MTLMTSYFPYSTSQGGPGKLLRCKVLAVIIDQFTVNSLLKCQRKLNGSKLDMSIVDKVINFQNLAVK